MKKILPFCLTFIFLFILTITFSSCSDAPSASGFSYAQADGGVKITAVRVRSRTLKIPESYQGQPVVEIADNAFYRSEDLRTVTIPASVKRIGVSAFGDCEKLNTLRFEEGGSCTIGESAFQGCVLLSKVEFNNSVVSVEDYAFMNCMRISHIKVGKELTAIGHDAFSGCERMLLLINNNAYAQEYADANSIVTDFFDSDYFFYIQLILAFIVGVAVLVLINFLTKKKKKNKKST